MWFDSFVEEKKVPPPAFSSLCVSVAGEGRGCVFGRMFCENQFMGRVAEGVRR